MEADTFVQSNQSAGDPTLQGVSEPDSPWNGSTILGTLSSLFNAGASAYSAVKRATASPAQVPAQSSGTGTAPSGNVTLYLMGGLALLVILVIFFRR